MYYLKTNYLEKSPNMQQLKHLIQKKHHALITDWSRINFRLAHICKFTCFKQEIEIKDMHAQYGYTNISHKRLY